MTHTLADRIAARDMALTLESLAQLIRSGKVPPWVILNMAPSIRMVGYVLKKASGQREEIEKGGEPKC